MLDRATVWRAGIGTPGAGDALYGGAGANWGRTQGRVAHHARAPGRGEIPARRRCAPDAATSLRRADVGAPQVEAVRGRMVHVGLSRRDRLQRIPEVEVAGIGS